MTENKEDLTRYLLKIIEDSADKNLKEKVSSAIDHYNQKQTDQDITVLISDLRGFTSLSDQYTVDKVILLLNHYFTRMNEIILKYEGVIDKYMGDSIMVIFGVPVQKGDDALRAVACAVEMQIAMDKVNEDNKKLGLPKLFMGIGINTGAVTSASLGSNIHQEYSVIGEGVNITARIEGMSLRGQVLISDNTLNHTKEYVQVDNSNTVKVKGKQENIVLHELKGISWPSEIMVPNREIRLSPRIEMDTKFEFNKLIGKQVDNKPLFGVIKDISYYGMFINTTEILEKMDNIRFNFSLSMLGGSQKEIYAKIMSVKTFDDTYGYGIEFTDLDDECLEAIKNFVNLVIKGN